MVSMLVLTTSTSNLYAQNSTANASDGSSNINGSGQLNASQSEQNTSAINRTELAQNASGIK